MEEEIPQGGERVVLEAGGGALQAQGSAVTCHTPPAY